MSKDKIKTIFVKTIKIITPAKQEFKIVDNTIDKINALLRKNKVKAVCVAGGSYAKGTILKNDFDIDLFVRFDYSYKNKDTSKAESLSISKILGKTLKSLKPELVHGSRDYYQLKRKIANKSMLFELVPVLKINNYKQAVNVTDMSPLHVSYVKKNMSANLSNDVRLAKQFCKAIKVYGAESYIRGFSGHVLDLLIIYYKGFENLLMQASVWGSKVVLDPSSHLRDPVKQLNKSKTQSPLIIVDPIQPDRNAAAAVSKEKFELFKQKAREFLDMPNDKFFVVKKLTVSEIKSKAKKNWVIVLKTKPLKGKDDVVGAKIMKCYEHLLMQLKKHEFDVIESGWEFGNPSVLYFIVKKEKMSDKIILKGPPVKVKLNAKMFKSKHKNVFEKHGRLFAREKRLYKTPDKLIKTLVKEDYVKQRVANISY